MHPFSPCSSLSHLHLPFCLPVNPSTCFGPGGELRSSSTALFPLPIQYEGESYGHWADFCTSLDTICYLSPVFMCGMHSLWSSLKFLHSAKRFRWLTSIRDEEELWGEPVIKHLPLLTATHFNSHSSHFCPACQHFIYQKKEIQFLRKLVLLQFLFCRFFSIPTLFGTSPHFHFISRWDGHVLIP